MVQDIFPSKFHNEYDPACHAEKDSPVLCYDSFSILIRDDADRIVFPTCEQLALTDPVYAFRVDEQAYFLYTEDSLQIPEGFSYRNIHAIRSAAKNADGMVVFTGFHLDKWYRNARYCGHCSAEMERDLTERAMRCPVCGKKVYPRLNPAVIVGVINQDRLLMTKYREGIGYYALIAGFSEIGETLEETVAREVMEEAGLKVKNIRYYKSQPWGIAEDLLAGFYCDVDGDTTIHLDENELKLAAWYSREEIELQPDSFSLTNEMMRMFKEGKVV